MTGTDLVAVPGLGLGGESWRPFFAALGAGPATTCLLPGYGAPTTRGTQPPRPVELAADLCDRISGPSILFGHSSSCQVVAHAARLCPEKVRRLVLVGPATDPRAASWPALAGRWIRTAAHEDPRQIPALVRQYRRTGLRSMLATMDVARRDDLRATLTDVRCPVVLVRGAHDRICPRGWLCTLAATGAGRTVIEVPDGAHMVPLTQPLTLARELALHLR